MLVLDNPLSDKKFTEVLNMFEGNYHRICVTDDAVELIQQFGFAVDKLNLLVQSRYLELKEREADERVLQADSQEKCPEINPNK